MNAAASLPLVPGHMALVASRPYDIPADWFVAPLIWFDRQLILIGVGDLAVPTLFDRSLVRATAEDIEGAERWRRSIQLRLSTVIDECSVRQRALEQARGRLLKAIDSLDIAGSC